ncbi:DUF58 domain-containing protein [Cohnella fermenti]|uniref:DUF58 domain-containing protein n=1 Tax=Cohnella fermenti TaxID=2565925 RepID=A0A4S4BK15_9BACL|nr:DUF58 domain-containing protein [Cohnella fermenti]THF75040.1 DUF58 domain-containing protein [Cohnella fermenti]
MKMSKVRFGGLAAALYAASLLFLLFQGGKTSLMLFVMLNALGLYLLLGRWSGIGKVQGARTFETAAENDAVIPAGTRLRLKLSVHVPGFWPHPYIIVRERLTRQSSRELQNYELSFVPDYKRRGTMIYETAPLKRGRYQFRSTECSTRDIFGLFEHRGSFDAPQEIRVSPRTVPIRDWRFSRLARSGASEQRASSLWSRETTQIDGVREYIRGDRMSRIHWNATARTGDWKSKEYERESLPRLVIVLDRRAASYRTSEQFELAVSVAASLLDFAFRRNMPIGFVSAGAERIVFGAGRGAPVRSQVMDHLIDAEVDGIAPCREAIYEASERFELGACIVLVSPETDDGTAKALTALASRRQAAGHIRIAAGSAPDGPEEAARLTSWSRMFQARGWSFTSLSSLEELQQALEVGSA